MKVHFVVAPQCKMTHYSDLLMRGIGAPHYIYSGSDVAESMKHILHELKTDLHVSALRSDHRLNTPGDGAFQEADEESIVAFFDEFRGLTMPVHAIAIFGTFETLEGIHDIVIKKGLAADPSGLREDMRWRPYWSVAMDMSEAHVECEYATSRETEFPSVMTEREC